METVLAACAGSVIPKFSRRRRRGPIRLPLRLRRRRHQRMRREQKLLLQRMECGSYLLLR
uniref:Uncharacterized protein n=1 Tax=Oryza glumipatula TaxID=40148 RepID=A0A0E0B1V4_9ORYZ